VARFHEITMSIATPPETIAFVTIGDVLLKMPDVPPERIRLVPTPGTATEADVVRIRSEEKRLFELVDGILVEKGMGFWESVFAQNLLLAIGNFVKEHDLGIIAGEAGMLRLAPGLVRIPDGSFVAWKQFPNRELPNEPILGLHPDLAIEVLSASNTSKEMTRKINEYYASGTSLVWIVDPRTQTVAIYTSPTESRTVGSDDILTGGEVLPGFAMPVEQIFRR
jgi:Uma2 family endonuclease